MAEEDLIFGKNRHFYGGLEPSNMLLFQANQAIVNGDPIIKLQCTLPNDTVYEGQTLCTVAGAVIKRKALDYPADEFDGQLVADVKESGDIFDTNVQNGDTYYYAAFPYTTQGVYNRNPVNRTVGSLSDFYAPGDMKTFTLSSSTNADGPRVRIVAALPDATTVDGVAVNEIGGAIIRKSIATYPVSETDGQLVANITEDSDFYDTNVQLDQTYYYSAFPYTIEGLYNRNPANRASVKVVGVPPGDMTLFKGVPSFLDNKPAAKFTVTLPPSIEGVYEVGGAMIRRGVNTYPRTISEGDFVVNATSDGVYFDNTIEALSEATQFYYTAFPYTTEFSYNENIQNNRYPVFIQPFWCMGFYDLISDENPNSKILYRPLSTGTLNQVAQELGLPQGHGFDNQNYSPIMSDESYAGLLNLRSWDLEPGEYFMPRPCALKADGTVAYYLDPKNYKKKTDGTPIDNMSVIGPNLQNAMLEWGKLYMTVLDCFDSQNQTRPCRVFAISNVKHNDRWHCWCNYDKNGNEIDHFYTSIYKAQSGYGSEMVNGQYKRAFRSFSGWGSTNYQYKDEYIAYGRGISDDYDIFNLSEIDLIWFLCILLTKSATPVARLGIKELASNSSWQSSNMVGATDELGMFGVTVDNTTGSTLPCIDYKLFGMENPISVNAEAVQGLIYRDGSTSSYKKLTRSTVDGSTVNDYNSTGLGYLTSGVSDVVTVGNFEFVTALGGACNGWGFTPISKATEGSATTYYASRNYLSKVNSTVSPGYVRGVIRGAAISSEFGYAISDADTRDTAGPYSSVSYHLTCHPSLPQQED